MKNLPIALLALLLIFTSCKKSGNTVSLLPGDADSVLGFVIADTIIYDVNIANRNPDDPWAEQRLKKLDRRLMIETIYDLVYNGKASAYNHTTGEKLTVKQVEELEKTDGFSRENVDMIQFKETWYLNPLDRSLTKKVISMVLGMQVYDQGQYIANRAIMRVELY